MKRVDRLTPLLNILANTVWDPVYKGRGINTVWDPVGLALCMRQKKEYMVFSRAQKNAKELRLGWATHLCPFG